MGSEDVGWKSCPAPTYTAENLTTCSTTEISTMQKWKVFLCMP